MHFLFIALLILISFAGCGPAASSKPPERLPKVLIASADTIVPPDSIRTKTEYDFLLYTGLEKLNAAPGTKSVLFNKDGSLLYAMNLEGMSIYEFDRASRKIQREFRFKPTKGEGWDYETDKPIPSFEEKPVEACLSHNDRFLWVSLHNAGGVVMIPLDSSEQKHDDSLLLSGRNMPNKRIRVHYPENSSKDSFLVPLIKTGKTPKVISRTNDSRHLLVSNWHTYNVSVIRVDTAIFPHAEVISTIPVSSIPRGIAVEDGQNRSFVAIMGGASLAVINNSVWMKEKVIPVASNPRHILTDTSGHLYVSYNKLGKIACIDTETGKTLFTAKTKPQPRTLMLSKNQRFIFVTCYSSDTVEVYRIDENKFTRIASLPCSGHPVGVDIYEDDDKLEAWVCSYVNGTITVFKFNKSIK